jgi:hypothetical protein
MRPLALALALSITYAQADTLIPIDIRPWACKKAISRFKTSDIPVAIFPDATGWPQPEQIRDIVIEQWLKPTRIEVVKNPKFCAVRAGSAERRVTIAWFKRSVLLNLYDSEPYGPDRVIAVLRVYGTVLNRDTQEMESWIGYASFNIGP